jgi:hypothetical protein
MDLLESIDKFTKEIEHNDKVMNDEVYTEEEIMEKILEDPKNIKKIKDKRLNDIVERLKEGGLL